MNPAFTEAWDRGACKPPSVAIRSLHNVINRYLAVTRPMEVESLSGGNIDIITFLARHSEREIFPQDVERRFGIHPVDVEQSARIDGTQRAYRARIRAEGRAVEENRAH